MPWIDYDALKQDLGIPADDTSKDAWLRRKTAELLSVMNGRVGDTLSPARKYRDIFHGRCFVFGCCEGLVPKHRPVIQVTSCTINQNMIDPAAITVTTDGRFVFASQTQPFPYASEVAVEYEAGFVELPGDILGTMLELLKQQLANTEAGGLGVQTVSKLAIIDVGSVELKTPQSFAEMWGPFGSILDRYRSYAIGGPLVVESYDLGPVEPPTP